MRNMLQDYFGFTKKELNGISVLCILIVLIIIFPWIYNRFHKPEVYQFDDFDAEVKAFLASASKKVPENSYKVRDEIEDAELKSSYFLFDPNGLDEMSWRKLGLSPRQIKVIKNYENKGGRFYKKEDLQRMYSISVRKYAELEPYIRIVDHGNQRIADKSFTKGSPSKAHISRQQPFAVVELNSADSASLETIRGIGPVFASRIVAYRNRLGGFYRKEQLLDIYGVDSAKYAGFNGQVKVDSSVIQKINVNSATFEDFKKHPYLTYKQMNAIVQYRKQHGQYRSIEDLKKIAIMNEEILRKIEPYLIY
jgi:competence protein ComEA